MAVPVTATRAEPKKAFPAMRRDGLIFSCQGISESSKSWRVGPSPRFRRRLHFVYTYNYAARTVIYGYRRITLEE